MFSVLEKIGMPNVFINMILSLSQNVEVRVNMNNCATNPFQLHRRVRQGCPLAPYLFIVVTNVVKAEIRDK